MTRCAIVHIETPDGTRRVEVKGRDLWTLRQLVEAGMQGITSDAYPGVRVAAHVHNLRKAGFEIETRHERHKGPFPGAHARYILHTTVHFEWASDPEPLA